jgi:hypothetical protein
MSRRRLRLTALGLEQRLSGQAEDQHLSGGAAPHEASRHRNPVLGIDADHSPVQELVMDAAQAKSVVHGVRSLERPPANMRGIEPDSFGSQSTVITAHRTAVLVRNQDALAETGIPTPKGRGPLTRDMELDRLQIEAHQTAYVTVQ